MGSGCIPIKRYRRRNRRCRRRRLQHRDSIAQWSRRYWRRWTRPCWSWAHHTGWAISKGGMVGLRLSSKCHDVDGWIYNDSIHNKLTKSLFGCERSAVQMICFGCSYPPCRRTLKLTWLRLPWSQIAAPCGCSVFVPLPNSLSFTPSTWSPCLCLKLPRPQMLSGPMRRQRPF